GHAHRELVTKQQANLLARKQRTPSQAVHGLNLAWMQIETGHSLRLFANGKENAQPTLVHLLVDEKLGKAPVNFILGRGAVRAEQILLTADGLVERALRFRLLRRIAVA